MKSYERTIVDTFWDYRHKIFADSDMFEKQRDENPQRPPVFNKEDADHNVLMPDNCDENYRTQLLNHIQRSSRHKWFGSMKSSQALAQSVFGNLSAGKRLDALVGLTTDDGRPMFVAVSDSDPECGLEHAVTTLGEEHHPTEIDVFLNGESSIAVECKFAETHVGACTIPNRENSILCDGNYYWQANPEKPCYLTKRERQYWEFIPQLFNWTPDADDKSCPLRQPYQLVRNILAVCVTTDSPDATVDRNAGHAVLLYDERNPAFHYDGEAMAAWLACKAGLKFPHLLQKCTWQMIARTLQSQPDLAWLVAALSEKYGIDSRR